MKNFNLGFNTETNETIQFFILAVSIVLIIWIAASCDSKETEYRLKYNTVTNR